MVPSSIYKKYEEEAINNKELEDLISKNHEKLNIEKPNFTFVEQPKVNDDFISNVSDVKADPTVEQLTQQAAPKTGVAAGEAVAIKPSEILRQFDTTVLTITVLR